MKITLAIAAVVLSGLAGYWTTATLAAKADMLLVPAFQLECFHFLECQDV